MSSVPTTDPQHERFDLYDPAGRPLGRSKPRGEVHRDGDWHRSLHLWVWGIDGEVPFIIFQRRSMTKDTWPGALDVAVGGHFRSGETLADTLREAEEELGLVVVEAEVVRLGRRFHRWRTDAFHDAEINEVFSVRSDQPLPAYRQHPEEIDGLVRVNVDHGLALFRGARESIPALSAPRGSEQVQQVELKLADFVDVSDDYAERTLQSIRQLAAGLDPAPFTIRLTG